MKIFDAVVFDMDGVIFDSERCVFECWKALSEKYRFENIEEPYRACIGTNYKKTKEIMLNAYGPDFPYDEYAKEASKMYHEKYDGGRLPMKHGVHKILNYLKDNNKKIALASSTKRETVVNQLRDAGILDYFDEIVTGDMVTKSKPAPDIFLMACKKIGVNPKRAFAVEDSFNGIRAAHAAGLRPIMVPDLIDADGEMKDLSIVVRTLDDVVLYLMD